MRFFVNLILNNIKPIIMVIPRGLKLNVFIISSPEQKTMQENGISIDLNECNLVTYTFYDISYSFSNENGLCTISSDGMDFLINMDENTLYRKIQEALYNLN